MRVTLNGHMGHRFPTTILDCVNVAFIGSSETIR